MTNPNHRAGNQRDSDGDAGVSPGHRSPNSTPRWLKVFGVIATLLILLVAILHLKHLRHFMGSGFNPHAAPASAAEHAQ